MRRLVRNLFFVSLFCSIVGITLFSKQILLKCVGWKAAHYCKEAFGAHLSFAELVWEGSAIVFKKGELYKEGEVEATFEEASLIPFLDWRERIFGGNLKLCQLKIIHQKMESRPVPTPPSPSSKLFTLHLDTTIEEGELSLYESLSNPGSNHGFFQHVHFDLTHHVHGKQMQGAIALKWEADGAQFITHFQSTGGDRVDLSAHFLSHSFPKLSHLVTYFFQSYLPEPSFQWEVLNGSVDGELEVALVKGVPLIVKGRINLNEIRGKNPHLGIVAACDYLGCNLDIDFSQISTVNGAFDLKGGVLSLRDKGDFWPRLCDLKNLHSNICIKEGKLESSTLKGCFMGMEGELVLDWQAKDKIMEMGFRGSSEEIRALIPKKINQGFIAAFPHDFFALDAILKPSEEGLKLEGTLSITDEEESVNKLFFGCILGGGAKTDPLVLIDSVSPSIDLFLEHLKHQFCLSQKRFGWFHGEGFPLQKFFSPFLFRDVQMDLSGVADFEGTFDERYLILYYEGRDWTLASPTFELHVDKVKKNAHSSVHYLDLKTWSHVGFLPLKESTYWQKNYDFRLEKVNAYVQFENQNIQIQNIIANSGGLDFNGDVHLKIQSLRDIDLIISVDKISGSAAQAQEFLTHFKPSLLWEIPVDGEVAGEGRSLFLRYHFNPTVSLVEGHVHGRIVLNSLAGALSDKNLSALVDYNCVTTDLSCQITDKSHCDLNYSAHNREEGREILVSGTLFSPQERLAIKALQRGPDLNIIDLTYGLWKGCAALNFQEGAIIIQNSLCTSEEGERFSFAGKYESEQCTLRGDIQGFKKSASNGKPQEGIEGWGTLCWKMREEICTIEGLEVALLAEAVKEKYNLGDLHYDLKYQEVFFEGFDFSLSSEKLSHLLSMAKEYFPEKMDLLKGENILQMKEPLEGHISLKGSPTNIWIYLSLKDGVYEFSDRKLDLKNFYLVYDPTEIRVWGDSLFRDHYYGFHLSANSKTMKEAELSVYDSNNKGCLTTLCEYGEEAQWRIKKIEGNFEGMEVDLTALTPQSTSLSGYIQFDPQRITPLLEPLWRERIETLSSVGTYQMAGEFGWGKENFTFVGTIEGQNCGVGGLVVESFSSSLEYGTDRVKISNCALHDRAGTLSVHEMNLDRHEDHWYMALDKLSLENVRFSRLQWAPGVKPLLHSLCIRSCNLKQCTGRLGEWHTLLGSGTIEFTNFPKKTLFSQLLFLPSEITARIGLDFSSSVPVRGIIDYSIAEGKVHFAEFKEMYSFGKRSRLYLADGAPAYIDFKGNLNLQVKMKQYSLLMKLAEFFTISVKGTLLRPTYTLSNQIDPDD